MVATTFQGSKILNSFGLISLEDIAQAVSVGGILELDVANFQKWVLRLTLEVDVNGRRDKMAQRTAHRFSQGATPFSTPMPSVTGKARPAVGVALDASANAGDVQIRVDKSSGTDESIGPLEFFTIGTDKKVYMTTGTTAVSTTARNMGVFPKLRKSAANNTALNFASPMAWVVYSPQSIKQLQIVNGVEQPTFEIEEFLV